LAVVDCSYVLAVKASPPDAEMARLAALRYGDESESVPGSFCDGTCTLFHLSSGTRSTPQNNAHAHGKPLFSEGIPWAWALLREIKSRQRFLRGETLTDP